MATAFITLYKLIQSNPTNLQPKVYPDGVGEIALVPLHTSTGRAIQRLKGHMGAVTAVTYRKQYNQVVSTGKDGMIFLWDTSVSDALDDERMEIAAMYNARSIRILFMLSFPLLLAPPKHYLRHHRTILRSSLTHCSNDIVQ